MDCWLNYWGAEEWLLHTEKELAEVLKRNPEHEQYYPLISIAKEAVGKAKKRLKRLDAELEGACQQVFGADVVL